MRILIFSDIHGDTRALEKLIAQPADLYVAAGDLSTFGRGLDKCGEVLRPLGKKLWVLPGNHETQEESRAFCEQFGFEDFHLTVRTLEGKNGLTHWGGFGYSNPTPFNTPGEYSEAEIAELLKLFENRAPLYFVVHFPPKGTAVDRIRAGSHAGSPTLRAWVDRMQPVALYCGHIHEAAGASDRLGTTNLFNVGKAGHIVEI